MYERRMKIYEMEGMGLRIGNERMSALKSK